LGQKSKGDLLIIKQKSPAIAAIWTYELCKLDLSLAALRAIFWALRPFGRFFPKDVREAPYKRQAKPACRA